MMNQTTKLKLLYFLKAKLAVIIVPVVVAFGVYLLLVTKYKMNLSYWGLLVPLAYVVFIYIVGVLFHGYSLMLKKVRYNYRKQHDYKIDEDLAQRYVNLESELDKFWYIATAVSFGFMLVIMVFGIFTNKESLCINYVNACFYLGLYALSTLVALRVYR